MNASIFSSEKLHGRPAPCFFLSIKRSLPSYTMIRTTGDSRRSPKGHVYVVYNPLLVFVGGGAYRAAHRGISAAT
jgi:hypothetical protein